MKQVKRFDAMSVHLAKSTSFATNEANEIAEWTSKLIDAVTRIWQEIKDEVAACRTRLQDKIHSLKTHANETKRKILESDELDSSRIIKTNFRLIFESSRATKYKSKITKAAMTTNLVRISVIRSLCESNSNSVIVLSMFYLFKVWAKESSDVFNDIIELVKKKTEQKWSARIVDIMNELKSEKSMSEEFKNLRDMINLMCNSASDWLASSKDISTYWQTSSKNRRLFSIRARECTINAR